MGMSFGGPELAVSALEGVSELAVLPAQLRDPLMSQLESAP